MFVVAVLNALIHTLELGFQLCAVSGQCFFNRRQQNRRADLAQDCIFALPALGADQVVLETAKIVTVPNVYVASFQGIAQQAIDKELVAVDFEFLVFASFCLGVHIALQPFRDDVGGEVG